jgi:hypothetical protein
MSRIDRDTEPKYIHVIIELSGGTGMSNMFRVGRFAGIVDGIPMYQVTGEVHGALGSCAKDARTMDNDAWRRKGPSQKPDPSA